MTDRTDKNRPTLTVIPGKKPDIREFATASLAEKRAILQSLPAKKKLDLILAAPDAPELIQALPDQEYFLFVKDLGPEDAAPLLELASPEQCRFLLDMELWQAYRFDTERALAWLSLFLEAGEERITTLLPYLDPELLVILFKATVAVGGGIGDLAGDEERLADWDHTFDNIYFVSFTAPKHARLVGTLLDIIFRTDHPLYLFLMEGIKHELADDQEDLAFRFRSGRLADLGFPERQDAVAVYSYLSPAQFVVAADKRLTPENPDDVALPALPMNGDSLIRRVLARLGSAEIYRELNALVNKALVADGVPLDDPESLRRTSERVAGYLNIAVEHLAGDEEQGAEIVAGEYLQRIFQLGFSLVLDLQRTAASLSSDNYASGRVLSGLRQRRPLFYRGLDPDRVDDYREFRGISDVRAVAEFLAAFSAG